jgi:hypothetical protein
MSHYNINKGYQDIIDFFNAHVSNNIQVVENSDELQILIDSFRNIDIFKLENNSYDTCDELNINSLERLFNNQISIIHIPNYISTELCEKIYNGIKVDLSENKWEHTDMFQGYGLPVNYMYGPTVNDCINYFSQVQPIIRKLRAISGGISPVDKLRLELDEIWPHGSKISSANPFNRKAFVGLTRLMKPDGLVGLETKRNGLVHIDGPLISDKHSTFSSNIYIKTPDNGGELCLWDVSLKKNSEESLNKLQKLLDNAFDKEYREEVQKNLQKILPEPIQIKPKTGDLIILNSCKPHAVKGFFQGERLSMQTFINHENGRSLELYS